MTPTRKKRLAVIGLMVLGVSTATAIALVALNDNIRFSIGPSEIVAGDFPEGRQLRLGGLVAAGSVSRDPTSLLVSFDVTDCIHDITVNFNGILPDLFREGQGVIAHGTLDANGLFQAHEVLARHDETYMPPEVARAMALAGGNEVCGEPIEDHIASVEAGY
ncbi:MAG: cytochrome c maturation protein CcmE [Wenzhouxiangella sp.]